MTALADEVAVESTVGAAETALLDKTEKNDGKLRISYGLPADDRADMT